MLTLLFYVVFFFSNYVEGLGRTTVYTKLGAIQGTEFSTINGRKVHAFLGVPYAKPPIGNNRFEEPIAVERWKGTWMAKELGSYCPQLSLKGVLKGNEDCLYMNIYTPTCSSNASLSVLLFFHGGSFRMGSAKKHTPKFLLDDNDIVYITIHYRLGFLGFLSTEDNIIPGNNGLKDQVLAMKWVKEYISCFGGDRDRVTIAGSSAGSASVHLHYLSPLSRGLFKTGISSSGCALNPWALTEEPLQKAKLLASSVGCALNNTHGMVQCMKVRPVNQLFSQLNSLFIPWVESPFTPFGPVIERSGSDPFLSDHPYKILSQGRVYDAPWLVSTTTEEGIYPGGSFIDRDDLLAELNNYWHKIAPHLMDFNFTVLQDNLNKVSDEIKMFYFGENNLSKNNTDIIIDMLSDRLFKADIGQAVRLQASVTNSSVFFFTFAYRANMSFSDVILKEKELNFGVSHLDDVLSIFGFYGYDKLSLDIESDREVAYIIKNIWLSFMESGIPSPGKHVVWDPVSPMQSLKNGTILNYLYINSSTDMKMVESVDYGNENFWNSLGLAENSKYSDKFNHTSSNGNQKKIFLIKFFLTFFVFRFLFKTYSLGLF